uniref:C1orf43 homolog n=1 Tax=Gallus gallus TaxID=9031 RepID=A0A8V1A858_CHICK
MAGAGSNWLSGVNVVLVMAYGSLVFVLLFIFVKRQIMRFAMKSRRGPHVPVGQHAPKDLKEEIDIRLSRVQDIKYEPQLLAEDDSRLLQLETQGDVPITAGTSVGLLSVRHIRGAAVSQAHPWGWARGRALAGPVGQLGVSLCSAQPSVWFLSFPGCYNYLYRMKALDAIRTSGEGQRGRSAGTKQGCIGQRLGSPSVIKPPHPPPPGLAVLSHWQQALIGGSRVGGGLMNEPRTFSFAVCFTQLCCTFCFPEIPFHAEGRYPKSLIGKNFCAYLLELRNSSSSFKGIRKALIDTLLDGYENARYGTGVFGKPEYLKYQDALNELANMTKARAGSSQRQHQSAAKDLTLSPEVSNPATIQVTYLPSSQKSKRAKHFLELKSFKDNYNTLESTL